MVKIREDVKTCHKAGMNMNNNIVQAFLSGVLCNPVELCELVNFRV